MKRLLVEMSIGLLLASAVCAKQPARKKPSSASVANVLLQMERDWSQAGVSKDTRTVDRILADDWVSVDFRGKSVTKTQAIAELNTPTPPSQPIELGDMKVRVFGDAAVVTGKDAAGNYAWMDVFLKRNGRWQAIASQSTKIER